MKNLFIPTVFAFLLALTFITSSIHINADASFQSSVNAKPVKQIAVCKDTHKDIQIKLRHNSRTWEYRYKVPDSIPNIHTVLELASKNLGYKNKVRTANALIKDGHSTEYAYLSVLDNFDNFLKDIEKKVYIKPRDAVAKFFPSINQKFRYIEHASGKELDRTKLFEAIKNGLDKSNILDIHVHTKLNEPDITIDELKDNTKKRISFSTSFASSTAARTHNVKLALGKFNGMTIMPNEILSFNEVVGARTVARGFKEAKIIIKGKFEDGVGGGVCQVSTTLYNAWLLANLEIEEYRAHSLPVSYVPLSFDATVSSAQDLKLKNNTQYPVYIAAYTKQGKAYIDIYGSPLPDGMEIKRRSIVTARLPHSGDEVEVDIDGKYTDLYVGELKRIREPKDGVKSVGFLDYYKYGKRVCTHELRKDTYKSQKGLVVKGTRAFPAVAEEEDAEEISADE